MIKCISDIEKSKMEQLVDFLNYHTKLYDEGKPQISNFEWDKKYFQLQNMEAETGYTLPDSPTHRIKYEVVNELKKVTHSSPMLSADKTKDWNTFINYFGIKDVIGMLKLDGLTCRLTYRGGRLVGAETRGNGVIGEDIRHNAYVIPSIPKIIDYGDDLIVDGEIICTAENFKPFAEEYKNPRNFAAGSIRLLNPNECKNRNLTFVAWNIVKGLHGNSFLSKLNLIDKMGFTIVPYTSSFDWDAKDFLQDKAKELGYPIDGLVGRFDDIEYGESLGSTDHHSKAIYAFKFYDEEYDTRLKYIDWTMSRNGVLTPVAVFEPIEIDGTTVERANLHNLSVMEDLLGECRYLGQPLKVAKMNMIIPQIMSATKMKYGDVISHGGVTVDGFSNDYGVLCPCCGSTTRITESEDGTKRLECTNEQCSGKLSNIIDHFVGKRGLDIKGLSIKTIEKLIDLGWLNSRKDIFELYTFEKEWKALPGFGDKSVEKVLSAIEESKVTNLESVIAAIGIPLVGRTVAKQLSGYFESWVEFRESINDNKYHFDKFDGIGYEIDKSLKTFDYSEIDEIVEKYLTIGKNNDIINTSNDEIKGKIFCVTGKSSLGSRDTVKGLIEAAGGKVTGSVSTKTNYLVANAQENTAKYNNAVKYNIPIINDEELKKMLKIF